VLTGERSLRPAPFHRTRFNGPVCPHRVVDHRSYPLEDIKHMRKLVDGATVNDVILSIVGGALRKYLAEKGETPDAPLLACVPVDMRAEQTSTEGNEINLRTASLAADVEDPVERLGRVHASTAAMKSNGAVGARALTELSERFPGALFAWGLKAATAAQVGFGSRRPLFNTVVTNVPGPPVPLYMNGARLTRMFGVTAVYNGVALMFAALSYAGEVTVSLFGCRQALPDPERLAACVDEAYAELARAAATEGSTARAHQNGSRT